MRPKINIKLSFILYLIYKKQFWVNLLQLIEMEEKIKLVELDLKTEKNI